MFPLGFLCRFKLSRGSPCRRWPQWRPARASNPTPARDCDLARRRAPSVLCCYRIVYIDYDYCLLSFIAFIWNVLLLSCPFPAREIRDGGGARRAKIENSFFNLHVPYTPSRTTSQTYKLDGHSTLLIIVWHFSTSQISDPMPKRPLQTSTDPITLSSSPAAMALAVLVAATFIHGSGKTSPRPSGGTPVIMPSSTRTGL